LEEHLLPNPFLETRVHRLDLKPNLVGLCAGYENGNWRSGPLAAHLMEWIPDFVLNHSEKETLRSHNAISMIRKAATLVYTSDKYGKRGELGELLLHAALRQVCGTVPAISKLYYKDSPNDTVKGFDAVHVVANESGLQLWLGEAKFYEDIKAAIRDSILSLKEHSVHDYLRTEFATIVNKIDPQWPHADKLALLLDKNTSLDVVFSALCIPVFLTYESPVILSHNSVTDQFKKEIEAELLANHSNFLAANPPTNLYIHLFLLPMAEKKLLQSEFDARLKSWQTALK
jgi:hypothetical protein